MKAFFSTIILVGLWCQSGWALGPVIGSVKTLTGDAVIQREGHVVTVQLGTQLYENDVLETGADSAMGLILRDDTMLSMGPDTQIVLDQFVFSPAEEKLGLVTRMGRGTLMYLSGQISKLNPGAAKLETPLAVLGIRGTRFLARVDE